MSLGENELVQHNKLSPTITYSMKEAHQKIIRLNYKYVMSN